VLVPHLDPDHPSILTEILQRSTRMAVVEADDKMPVLPDRVHVIPPNRDMVLQRGALQLSLPTEPRGQRLPIDALFRSLAEDQGDNAAGIILSGSGTDGTLGLRAIHGAGGLCLVQEPSGAKYDGMPASAIQAGHFSQVLAVDKMPQALLLGLPGRGHQPATALPDPGQASGLNRVLALLRSSTGHDFSQYKKSTIGRRVERRMTLHGITDPADYARHLRLHPDELQTLFRELLINVTSFFRDPQAFAALKTEVLPTLLAGRPDNAVLRIWVAGCATGEEAYSLAILLHEWMDENHQDLKIQFYATDLDDDAIATARAGLYPPNIAQDVSPERLRRCFSKENNGFRVRKEIREMVVFAIQSVIKDPPFTRLDLLSCRNLMIYLEPELQDRLIPAFHYALKAGGVLFLSPSEGIGRHADLFEPVNRRWKLYRARPSLASTRSVLASGLSWAADSSLQAPQDTPRRPRETQIAELARRSLLQAFAPAAVVIDLQGNILYVHGETGRFLRPAPGQPSHRVVDMARDGLQTELREALRRAADGQPTLHRVLQVRGDGPPLTVSLSVQTMPGAAAASGVLLVSFQELPAEAQAAASRKPRGAASAAQLRVQELERELAEAREHMSAMLEEQQASNEELKSTNEELQSTNEELQSTNEELETSKEELQSVNEEMVTVNAELQTKIDQMAGMQDDMKNLLDNMRLGTIFLDRQLTIRRFTRDAARIYRLLGSDVGRPLADFRSALVDDDLLADALTVLKTLKPVEREVCTTTGTWYLARIQPYRTVDNAVDGVVLSFADVTEQVQAIAARKARELAEAIVEAVPVPLVVLDAGLRVVSANRAYFSAFGGAPADTAGRPYVEIGAGQWDLPALRQLLEQVLPLQRSVEHQEVTLAGQGGGPRQLSVSARCIADPAGNGDLVLLVIEPGAPATAT
jgi:two-component system CheB/CheR fusion protein